MSVERLYVAHAIDRRRAPKYDGGVILVGRGLLLLAILSVVSWWVL